MDYPRFEDEVDEFYKSMAVGGWWGWPMTTASSSAQTTLPEPKTKADVDALRQMISALPTPMLAKLYVDLYDAHGMRIDSARTMAEKWYTNLP
jgi:hypothetical protein